MAVIGSGWSKYVPLTIPAAKIDADLVDFPVKIILNSDRATMSAMQDDGDDIRITKADGTILNFEKEIAQNSVPTGYSNASYETEFNGSSNYDLFSSASNLLKPIQSHEIKFTGDNFSSNRTLLYLEFADTIDSTWSDVKLRYLTLKIDTDGHLAGRIFCRNNNDTTVDVSVTGTTTISTGTKYTARLDINHWSNTIEIFLDGDSEGSVVNTHCQRWGDVNSHAWCVIGANYYYPFSLTYSGYPHAYSNFFDGTIHSYDFSAYGTDIAVYHGKIPNVSSTSNTELRVYYGNDSATDAQNATGVWDSDFKLVMHMGDMLDSTSNDNDGTNNGTISRLSSVGYYRSFDGSDDYILVADSVELRFDNNFTAEILFKPTDVEGTLISKRDVGGANYQFQYETSDYKVYDGSTKQTYSASITENTDQLATWRVNSLDVCEFYKDGVSAGTKNCAFSSDDAPLYVGKYYGGGGSHLTGNIYEIRISSVPRSDAWIKATSYSLADDLISYGEEVSLARPWMQVIII